MLNGEPSKPRKKQKRYSRRDANNLFLKYSFYGRLLGETVHTPESEKIVSDEGSHQISKGF
jgi:hypothetical protein